MKKIPLHFRKESYDLKLQSYQRKLQLQKEIENEFKKTIEAPTTIEYCDSLNCFYKMLEIQKKEQNSLGLTGEKLSELLSIDTSNIKQLQSEFIKLAMVENPSVEDFTTYAETTEEIEKYNMCIGLIKGINVAKNELQNIGTFNHFKIFKAFAPLLVWDSEELKFIPNNVFIKN